jgi:catechol 2,3-dioxygenase-like lactoylglutathione lyase family enzyme
MTTTSTHLTGIRTVSVPVDDQEAALHYYVDILGFTLLRDAPTPSGRWIELAPGDESVIVTLEPAAPGVTRGAIGIRFTSDDVDAAHDELAGRGVSVEDILRWPGVPPMFAFRDLDGNVFSVTATT